MRWQEQGCYDPTRTLFTVQKFNRPCFIGTGRGFFRGFGVVFWTDYGFEVV